MFACAFVFLLFVMTRPLCDLRLQGSLLVSSVRPFIALHATFVLNILGAPQRICFWGIAASVGFRRVDPRLHAVCLGWRRLVERLLAHRDFAAEMGLIH